MLAELVASLALSGSFLGFMRWKCGPWFGLDDSPLPAEPPAWSWLDAHGDDVALAAREVDEMTPGTPPIAAPAGSWRSGLMPSWRVPWPPPPLLERLQVPDAHALNCFCVEHRGQAPRTRNESAVPTARRANGQRYTIGERPPAPRPIPGPGRERIG